MNKSLGRKILAVLAAAAVPFTTLLSSAPLTANAADNYINPDTLKSSLIQKGKEGSTNIKGRNIAVDTSDNYYLPYTYNNSIYVANSSMYDYLSDNERKGWERDSKSEDYTDPYVELNWMISNENYDIPLYFGCFYRGDYGSNYTAYNKGDGWKDGNNPNGNERYSNFYWQANMSLREDTRVQNSDINKRVNFDASVQGLVDNTLNNDGTITQNGRVLPYFSDNWADSHPNTIKYWHDISFPFYGIDVDAKKVHGDDNRQGTAQYYQFNSRELNLQLETNDSSKTGRYKETSTQIYSQPTTTDSKGTVCYFPFNSSNDYTKNDLAFGTYFDINFKIQSDGKVETVDSSGKGTGTYVNATFEFMGDDDVWVFIDGKLVLDLGGDHKDTTGIIDFAEQKAYANDAIRIGDGGSKDNINGNITSQRIVNLRDVMSDDTFNSDGTYNEDKTHDLRMFYMERGMFESDLLVRFNFSAIPNKNTLKVREVTNFTGINAGLVDLTKKAADYDVFNYTVSNKGTAKDDVGESGIFTPTYNHYQRQNQKLTANLTGSSLVQDTTHVYLQTDKNIDGNTWTSADAIVAAYMYDGTGTPKTVLGEKVGDDLYRFESEGYTKLDFVRVSSNFSGSFPYNGYVPDGSVWNKVQLGTFTQGATYRITGWTSASLVTATPRYAYDYSEKNFVPTGTDYNAVANTNYTWTDEFAVKTSGSEPDGMTGTTDSTGSFNLMYGTVQNDESGTSEKESSAFFNAQFKKDSTMAVTQNSELNTVTRGDGVETFSADKGRTVGKYYDTTVSIVDKDGIDITNNGTVTETNYSYSNNDGKGPVQITQTFTNTPRVGALSVSKELANGDTADDIFTFTVKLENIFGISEVQINSYNNVIVTIDGTDYSLSDDGSFYLTGGQTAAISGIPYGTKYTLTETDTSANYQSSGTNSFTGTIGEGDTTSGYGGTVTNVRRTNTLTLSKSLLGDYAAEDENKTFTFRVRLTAPAGVDLSKYAISGAELGSYTDNSYTFDVAVSKNTPVTISGIPYGTQYSVYEPDDVENWEKDASTVSGVINATAAVAGLSNTFAPPAKFGSLRISKNVLTSTGLEDIPDDMRQQEFSFTVTLKNAAGEAVSGVFATLYYLNDTEKSSSVITFSTSGEADFTLKDDESIVISNIPADTVYTVRETINAEYDTVSEGTTGTIQEDSVAQAKFTNTKKFIPYTLPESGFDDTRMYFVFALSGMMLCGLAYFFVNRKKINS